MGCRAADELKMMLRFGPRTFDSAGALVDFNQPIFTEDYQILLDLQGYCGGKGLLIGRLFQAARKAGLTTATVRKSGSAFLQDIEEGGYILDERFAYPLGFAKVLRTRRYGAAANDCQSLRPEAITLATTNGDPTSASGKKDLPDNSTSDPTDHAGTPQRSAHNYLMGVYLDVILAQQARRARRGGELGCHRGLGHGHSSVSGPLDLFPPAWRESECLATRQRLGRPRPQCVLGVG